MDERLIDANALLKLRTPIYGCGVEYAVLERIIQNAPTIDAVRMVRCRECKHAASTHGASAVGCYTCFNEQSPCRCRFVEPSFGCLCGERKGGAT